MKKSKVSKRKSGRIVIHVDESEAPKIRNEVHFHHIMTTHAHVIESKKHKKEKHKKDYSNEYYE